MQTIRERLTLFLLTALPFHALAVTVLTKVIAGPGNPPLSILALWKEVVLAAILGIAVCELFLLKQRKLETGNGKWGFLRDSNFEFRMPNSDVIDLLILLPLALSFTLFLFGYPSSLSSYLFGFKYDFVPLVAFLLLRRVVWSKEFFRRIEQLLILVGGIVAGFGLVSFVLPMEFFVWLGYSDLHSLYVASGPLAPFQQIGGSSLHRIQSTMSGPNQLGLWLLLPFSIAVSRLLVAHVQSQQVLRFVREKRVIRLLSSVMLLGSAIVLTFSRSAWIGALVIVAILFVQHLDKESLQRSLVRFGACAVIGVLALLLVSPKTVVRLESSREHLRRPLLAIQEMIQYPLGRGLSIAGPASNRLSDTCVDLPVGSDASWAAPHTQLCVFVGAVQVQPTDRVCQCPLIPENWYLQIGLELGFLGMALFVWLTLLILHTLRDRSTLNVIAFNDTLFTVFLGISIAALVLHAWEDSAVAYTVWFLVATILPQKKRPSLLSIKELS